MKYYSNIIFRILISFYVLTIITTIIIGYFSFLVSGLGCSLGCAPDYTEKVIGGLLPPVLGIILFLACSIIILFMQQYKNYRFGYLTFITAVIGSYIFYKIFSFIPIWYFIYSSFEDISDLGVAIFWIVISVIAIVVAIVPFYVLINLIWEDFFKKRKIIR